VGLHDPGSWVAARTAPVAADPQPKVWAARGCLSSMHASCCPVREPRLSKVGVHLCCGSSKAGASCSRRAMYLKEARRCPSTHVLDLSYLLRFLPAHIHPHRSQHHAHISVPGVPALRFLFLPTRGSSPMLGKPQEKRNSNTQHPRCGSIPTLRWRPPWSTWHHVPGTTPRLQSHLFSFNQQLTPDFCGTPHSASLSASGIKWRPREPSKARAPCIGHLE
jgi:hypothetical protein